MPAIIHNHRILPHTYNAIVTDEKGQVIEEQLVKVRSRNIKAIRSGNKTIVILGDGSKGIAKRNPSDPYNMQVGYDIAKKRAEIKSLEKEIRELSKTGKTEERLLERRDGVK